jgi:hypothetical protein
MSNQFVKLYIKDIARLRGVSNCELLHELFRHVDAKGMVHLNAYLKDEFAQSLGISKNRIDHLLREYVQKDLLKNLKKGSGGYMLNPFLFFKGKEEAVDSCRKIYQRIERIQFTNTYTSAGIEHKAKFEYTDPDTGEIIELSSEYLEELDHE